MFIAEQQMVAAATGLAARGYKPFASTFAAFLTRARDFIRMGDISGVDLRTDPTQRVTRSADCLRTCALPWGTAATGCWGRWSDREEARRKYRRTHRASAP